MRFIVRRALSAVRLAVRNVLNWKRINWFLATQDGLRIEKGVSIGKDVVLRSTAGASTSLGSDTTLSDRARVQCRGGIVEIGPGCFIGIGAIVACQTVIKIGRDCQIAENVTIRDHDHKFGTGVPLARSGYNSEPVLIGANVWIGAGVVVLKGVSIGDGVVVGAGAVVTRNVASGTTVIGVPARPIKKDFQRM